MSSCERGVMDIRLSAPGLRVLRLFLQQPLEGKSGAEISRLASVGSGTLYPLLARWEKAGWVTSEWENVDPSEVGRPRRRFYRLTAVGQTKARDALADVQVARGDLAWV
jgi:PadR family transcriptional regulator, regulatory protein PadR